MKHSNGLQQNIEKDLSVDPPRRVFPWVLAARCVPNNKKLKYLLVCLDGKNGGKGDGMDGHSLEK